MAQHPSRRWTDYVGFAVFVSLAAWTFVRMPTFSIFLVPTFVHELFLAVAFLTRHPQRLGAPSLISRFAAHVGTFMLLLFFHAMRTWYPSGYAPNPVLELRMAGALLWLLGAALSLLCVWALRRSFSIEPQARQLVISGPYAYARHPIYACYFLQYGGLLLMFPTVAFLVILAIWAAVMLVRMHFEERVLAAAFPAYAEYKAKVGAFAPKRRRTSRSTADSIGNPIVANHG